MVTGLFSHSACFAHDTGEGHPECPERLRAVLNRLEGEEFFYLDRREAPRATAAQIARVHPGDYVDRILRGIPQAGLRFIDGDTIVSPGSGEAALRAAGAVCAAIDAVMQGEMRNAFCAVRPPGHHAEPNQAMGFCLFNNVAVGAMHARDRWKLQRIAVVDFDVHHGNGTQEIFYRRSDVLTVSVHADPQIYYPFYIGYADERGSGEGEGFNLNLPLEAGSGDKAFQAAVARGLEAVADFGAEALVIALGYDSHQADPLSVLSVTTEGFAGIGRLVAAAGLPTVVVQEGGYQVSVIGDCLEHFLSGLAG